MLTDFINALSDLLYSHILIILLLGAGIFFTIKTKFVQIRMFIESLRVVAQPGSDKNGLSSFQALDGINRFQSRNRKHRRNLNSDLSRRIRRSVLDVAYGYSRKRICIYRKYACSNLQTQSKGRKFLRRTCILYSGRFEEALDRRPFRQYVLILTYMGGFNLVASFNIADSFRVYSFLQSGMDSAHCRSDPCGCICFGCIRRK